MFLSTTDVPATDSETPAASEGGPTAPQPHKSSFAAHTAAGEWACLACQRKFRSEDHFARHVRSSALHQSRIAEWIQHV